VDQADLAMVKAGIGGSAALLDLDGDRRVTQADVTAFQSLQKGWSDRAMAATAFRPGSVLVTAAR
jgi:hypothetical protein